MPYAALNEKEKNIVRHIFSLHTTTRQELCAYTRYTLPSVYRTIYCAAKLLRFPALRKKRSKDGRPKKSE